jgi:hypothetical protein
MIFLSHSRADKPAARRLVEALVREGVPAWIDEQQLYGGESLQAALYGAIASSNVYLYLVSAANASEWVQKELEFALGLARDRLKVIPIRLAGDDTAMPLPLADLASASSCSWPAWVEPSPVIRDLVES